ncbi:MAG: hypothetical protein QMD95_04755 [Candidatus Hodarchaeaceae archaeon]|nr:hypothetical protein [Candidatus Hodarchaeaceae archaeon]
MRGQTAVEYLLVFSTALVLFASVTMAQMITPASDAARDSLYLSQARSAADAIAGAIDTVYANGRGAVKSVSFQMDTSWTLQLDNIGNKLRIIVETSKGTENVEDNLRYEVDNYHSLSGITTGTYTVIVEWPENGSIRENINSSALANKKIYIYIRPRGR